MRLGVFADVHANLPALEAVLEALGRRACDLLVCLGDIVGYGASPAECVQLVRANAQVIVAGNHDRDVVHASCSPGTSGPARRAQAWTRDRLGWEELELLDGLPSHQLHPAGFVAAHGSYLSNIFVSGYVTSTMLEANLRSVATRAGFPRLALCGHTHMAMFGALVGKEVLESRLDAPSRLPARAEAVLVNPGSVGQPRDGDARASFAVIDFDAGSVEAVRVEYDVERAVAAVLAAGLPADLGHRLREGR